MSGDLRALAAALGEAQSAIRRDRERAVEQLRSMVPGLVGRLEGPRLFVTEAEAALIRASVPLVPREPGDPLAGIGIVVE